MNIISYPETRRYKRPWLLGQKELIELSNIIEEIKIKLDDSLNLKIKNESEERLKKENRALNDKNLSEGFEWLKNYYRSHSKNLIYLKSIDDKKIKSEKLIDILKDPMISDFITNGLIIEITRDFDNKFEFDISTLYDGDLNITIKCTDTEIRNDIEFLINKWVKDYQSNNFVQLWSKNGDIIAFSLFWILISVGYLIFAFASLKNNYKNELKSDVHELLEDSISTEEITKALEIILKYQTNYVPEDAKKSQKQIADHRFNFLYAVPYLFFALLFKPLSVIGVGPRIKLLKIYRFWIKLNAFLITGLVITPLLFLARSFLWS